MTLGPNQEKWLAALESKTYHQTTGTLCLAGEFYCCLGVAVVVCTDLEFIQHATHPEEDWRVLSPTNRQFYTGGAPPEVVKALALHGECGESLDVENVSLVTMNDEKRLSFPDIAAHVRAAPANYFREPR